MRYELFTKLYSEALDYSDLDMYIGERGWQDWMEEYVPLDSDDPAEVVKILSQIFELARMDIKDMRARSGLSFRKFSALYDIPERTVQDWEYGKRNIPEYTKRLLAYTMLKEGKRGTEE